MASSQLGFGGFLARWVAALLLAGLIFNPTGWSYVHWVQSEWSEQMPLKLLAGVVLLIALVIFVRATWRSIGALGIVLVTALVATLVWLLVDLGWLKLEGSEVVTWVALVLISTVLAVGMSWSHVRRRLTGQIDGDDVGD
ncbi:MAG: DUF6524 family protein [Pseudomonadota bacterium]